jgi:hypothetical protein
LTTPFGAGTKEIPVFDISVYINGKDFRYVYQMHYYCEYSVKLGLFAKYSILKFRVYEENEVVLISGYISADSFLHGFVSPGKCY